MGNVHQHLDDIIAAQSGQCETFGLTDTDHFLIVALYLSPADLESIRPTLRADLDRPVLGVGSRYRGYPIYPVDECPAAGPGCAEYRGVWFAYFPMSHVEGVWPVRRATSWLNQPGAIPPTWRTSTVVSLAAGIDEEQAFDRLPILADALQDAGCDNTEILDHCRGSGPHVQKSWVVDLVLGKE